MNAVVGRVTLPGVLGQMEILPGHTRLVALLKEGEVSYFEGGAKKVDIEGGLAEVADDNVTLLISNTKGQ